MPVACMRAYAVVGPTNRKPLRFKAFAIAVDSGVTAGTSPVSRGAARSADGANDHSSSSRLPSSATVARALAMVASTFARFRTMPASAIRRTTSSSPKPATTTGSNPAKAARNASRLRRIVIHDRPDWNASRLTRSNSRPSPRTGRPHSSSWYAT